MLDIIFKSPNKIFFNKDFNCFYSINELIEIKDETYILKIQKVKNYINYYLSQKCYNSYIFQDSNNLLVKLNLNVLVEYASPNPVSHIHFGNLVNAVYGNSFYTFLKTKYLNVTSQFYVNDLGAVIGKAVYALTVNQNLDYSLGYEMYNTKAYTFEIPQAQLLTTHSQLRTKIVEYNLIHIIKELSCFNIIFDKFQYESKQIPIFESIKLRHTQFFEENTNLLYFTLSKNNKILCNKSTGDLLYFSKDLALNYIRVSTYDLVYIILGEDHKLYVGNVIKCLKLLVNKSNLFVLFTPTITTDKVKMSKRIGNVLLVKDILSNFQLQESSKIFNINNLKLHILLEICKNYESDIKQKQQVFENMQYYFNTLSKIKEKLDQISNISFEFGPEDYALINYKIYCVTNLQHISFTKFLNEFHFYFKKGINYLNINKINKSVLTEYYNFLMFLFETVNLTF